MSIRDLITKSLPKIEFGCKDKAAVRAVQAALAKLGFYYGKIDGGFGKLTDGAVREFQTKQGVSSDGEVGPVTAALLDMRTGVLPGTVPAPPADAQTFPYRNEYAVLWQTIEIKNFALLKSIDKVVAKLRMPDRWKEYTKLYEATGVPPQVTAVINERECGGNLKGVLHNGELIVGTNRKTRLVPAGRGPFATFFAAGVDAFRKEGLDTFDWQAGGPARVAYALEKFNGFGYRKRGIHSPYLWAATTHYVRGKFVSDGVYNANAVDQQLGGMAILRRMMDLDPSLKF